MNDVANRRPLAMQRRQNQNYQRYMDKMNEALNKNIEKNIFPYWRNHQSLKGNYLEIIYTLRLVFNELSIYIVKSDNTKAIATT